MQVANQKVTIIDYTLTDASGEVIDQASGGEFAYLHGHQNIIPGLESALEGKAAGDEVNVTVEPDQAYGDRDDRLLQSVPLDIFPDASQVEVGSRFQAEGPDGQPMVLTVTEVGDAEAQVDANHPLAGETLTFDVKVVDVRDASEDELAHGHPHM